MGSTHWGGGDVLTSCSTPPPPNIEIKKKNSFVDMMLSNVLRDLLFSQTQPLKLADNTLAF